jgi:Ca2+-binding RTX toxin-like protein
MATIIGTNANNNLNGTNGDDLLAGRGGDDTLAGGAGQDSAWSSGLAGDYLLGTEGGLLTLLDRNGADGDEGIDRLTGIEQLRFSDATLTVASEVRVNSTTLSAQLDSAVTALADGGYVVIWSSLGQDGGLDIYAQRYDAMGVTLGGEVRVNSLANGDFNSGAVTALTDGGYVVTWNSFGQDGSGSGIYAQRYDMAGASVGGEVQVNSTTLSEQLGSAVTALTDGGYVVTWTSLNQDGSGSGIYAQRYDATGVAVGGEVLVNSTTLNDQFDSAVTALADGGYVVTWQSSGQDGSGSGIYAQQYDASGAAVGSEVQVNTFTANGQGDSAVTALADGGYVVTWSSFGQDGSSFGIYAQRYDAVGSAVGAEFQVNSTIASIQFLSAVTALADGGYVVTWTSYGQDNNDGSPGIYAQRYDAAGNRVGGEVRVNSTTLDNQSESAVTALADGGFVVTWSSSGQDGSSSGIYAQRYDAAGAAVGLTVTGTAGADRLSVGVHSLLTVDGAGGNDTLTGGVGADILLGSAGLDSLTGNGGNDYLDGGIGADLLIGGAGGDTYVIDHLGDKVTEIGLGGTDQVQASVTYTLGATLEDLILTGTGHLTGIGNVAGNLLQGNSGNNLLDGKAGGDLLLGEGGDDRLVGGLGQDVLLGGAGADDLIGGTGHDRLTGGADADRFLFHTVLSAATNIDEITDFAVGVDQIQLSRGVFAALPVGTLQLGAFRSGAGVTTAGDTDDRLIYDTTSGALYYDADGTGAAAAIKFATLTGSPDTLSATDFTVIAAPVGLSPLASLTAGVASRATSLPAPSGAGLFSGLVSLLATKQGTAGADRLTGGAGADRLLGGAGQDRLTGNAGADYLDGGTDADLLIGGAGGDTYVIDHAGDLITETGLSGTDTVRASLDYTLGATLEDLVLTGTGDLTGIGNASDNWLQGNSGHNTLIGLAGDDYLAGGAGDDTYRIAPGDGRDIIAETGGTADRLWCDGARMPQDLILSRQADDLRLAVQGSRDAVTIQQWFSNPAAQIETIQAGNGLTLVNSQVDQLLQAMATFTQQTGVTWDQAAAGLGDQTQFQAIIAANWN